MTIEYTDRDLKDGQKKLGDDAAKFELLAEEKAGAGDVEGAAVLLYLRRQYATGESVTRQRHPNHLKGTIFSTQ